MKVKSTKYSGDVHIEELHDFVARSVEGSSYETGELEAMRHTTENVVKLLGKLINVLAERDMITIDQLNDILGTHHVYTITKTEYVKKKQNIKPKPKTKRKTENSHDLHHL